MTSVFKPLGAEGFELCQPVDKEDFETINLLINGEPRAETWKPLRMKVIHEDQGRRLARSDSPWLGAHALIFRREALSAIGSVLEQAGELLPLECDGEELSIFNPALVVDALDEQASSILRFKSGRVMGVTKHVFRPALIREAHVFKIPNLRVSPTFVTEAVVRAWTDAGLKGLDFIPVWAG